MPQPVPVSFIKEQSEASAISTRVVGSEPEVFGWSQIPNNTGSRRRIFCPTPDVQLDHFLHHTPKLGIPVEMVQFLAVHHDFH